MLDEICAECKNYFIRGTADVHAGTFTIRDGVIQDVPFLTNGQYFRIVGSLFNDGVWNYKKPEPIPPEPTPYSTGLDFISNGNGTCVLIGCGTCTDADVVIPPVSPSGDSVIEIAERSFEDDFEITSVKIPASVRRIGDRAFDGSLEMQSATVEAVTPPLLDSYEIIRIFGDAEYPIYVKSGSLEQYKAEWNEIASRIRALEEPEHEDTGLTDETFDGAIWAMRVPPAFIALSDEIKTWQTANDDALKSPYQSESFGGYSYSKANGANGAAWTWKDQFSGKLNRWRRLSVI